MLTLEKIRMLLQDRTMTVVAEATGVHHQTIMRIKTGEAKNTSYQTVKALSDYFEAQMSK